MHGAYEYTHGHCSVNPFVGRESQVLNRNGKGRKAVVVGAGVAGLTAAELLAKRGFDVTVLEKNDKAGGQINLADKPPHKEKIAWCVADLVTNAEKAGAKIQYSTTATKELIDSMSPEYVLNATGANAIFPKAFAGKNVCTVTDILDGDIKLNNKKVTVIGSGMTGLETSELLCSMDNKVTVVEMADQIAPGAWFQQVDDAMPVLRAADTKFMPSHKYLGFSDGKVSLENLRTGETVTVDSDYVVLSLGCRPDTQLFDEIKDSHSYRVINIGDSEKVGRIANATESAYQAVISIK